MIRGHTSLFARSWLLVVWLVLLGHALGTFYLEFWAQRQLVGGVYVSKMQPQDTYETVEWDAFSYYPRALAVVRGSLPLDPWAYHEHQEPGWGLFPPFPPLVFGSLTAITGDLHLALYVAVVLMTVLQGTLLMRFFHGAPLALPAAGAWVAAVWIIRSPWFGAKTLELPLSRLYQENVLPFLLGRPLDSFPDIEAGLFTYLPYVIFLVAFWKYLYATDRRSAVVTGAATGFLVYVYYYHYVFAFALLGAAALTAAAVRDWKKSGWYLTAMAFGIAIALPHLAQLAWLSSRMNLPEYVRRMGLDEGWSVLDRIVYLRHVILLAVVAVGYAVLKAPGPSKSMMLRVFSAVVVAYAGVLNLQSAIGFNIQSDHYWRQSLGLPATFWVIIAGAELFEQYRVVRPGLRRIGQVVAVLLVLLIPLQAAKNTWLWLHWFSGSAERPPAGARYESRSKISSVQRQMITRMELLKPLVRPGDVLLVADPPTAYHATVNLRARLFVPFTWSVLDNREILQRFLVAQYLTGADRIRPPGGLGVPLRRSPDFFALTNDQKFLFGGYFPKGQTRFVLDPPLMGMLEDITVAKVANLYADRMPRVDVVFGHADRQRVALERISRRFHVVQLREGNGFWAVRVHPGIARSGAGR